MPINVVGALAQEPQVLFIMGGKSWDTIQLLLGDFYPEFAVIQKDWLRELVDNKKYPAWITRAGVNTLRKYVRGHEVKLKKKLSTATLRSKALAVYLKAVGELLQTDTVLFELYNADVEKAQITSSATGIFDLLTNITKDIIRSQLIQIFVLVCAHVTQSKIFYNSMVECFLSWSANSVIQFLPCAEKFIVLLLAHNGS